MTVIAVAGKGGTGKTTIAALIVGWLRDRYPGKSLLAVDADPVANLHLALGCPLPARTVGRICEEQRAALRRPRSLPPGVSRPEYLRRHLGGALVRAGGFDLLVMGRGPGTGCYCGVNNALAEVLPATMAAYELVVIDNEAGLEHISRCRIRHADHLFLVADPGRGLVAAVQVVKVAGEVGLRIDHLHLLVNRLPIVDNGLRARVRARVDGLVRQLLPAGVYYLSDDAAVLSAEAGGRPVGALPADSRFRREVEDVLRRVLCV